MKLHTILFLSALTILVGCGKSKSSSNESGPGRVGIAGVCSQATIDLHRELLKKSEQPITGRTRINDVNRSCVELEQQLGNNSCQDFSGEKRSSKIRSYADVADYCARIADQASSDSPRPTPPPRPEPIPSEPSPRPPQYSGVLVQNLNNNFYVRFEKSYLDQEDTDVRYGKTRCVISIPSRGNDNLRNQSGNLVSIKANSFNGNATYDITAALSNSGFLVRFSCKSHNIRLTVNELNQVLDGVAEIRPKR